MDSELQKALDLAKTLGRQAGEVTLKFWRTGVAVERKVKNEPVTEADRQAQEVILRGLEQGFTGYGILAEESEDKTSWARHQRAWVVDPLDGTKDFIADREGFSVMIGLLDAFRPILGVVYQPTTERLYYAAAGQGCFLEHPSGHTQRLRTSDTAQLPKMRLVSSQSHRSREIDRAKQALGITDERNVGSVGLKVGLIAQKDRDLYINPRGLCKLWDVCAPQVLLHEAGGTMTDLYGQPLSYQPEHLRVTRGILASNGPAHDKLVCALQQVFPEPPDPPR